MSGIYKKATGELATLGLEYLIITKRSGGAAIEDIRANKMISVVFKTAQEAVQAVKGGYRPQVLTWKNDG